MVLLLYTFLSVELSGVVVAWGLVVCLKMVFVRFLVIRIGRRWLDETRTLSRRLEIS